MDLSPGTEEAERTARKQRKLIARQRREEMLRRAEAESEVASRKAKMRQRTGRSSLIATSPMGVTSAANKGQAMRLGGT